MRPRFMSDQTLSNAARRIEEHVVAHRLNEVNIVFHGGEPLLLGPSRLEAFCSFLRENISCKVRFGLQTNATLINERFIEVFRKFKIGVGVSVDGLPSDHDKFRVFRNGAPSSPLVQRGLNLLAANKEIFGGILCVINLVNDPIRTYEYLTSTGARQIDFLLPHGNWVRLPPGIQHPDEAIKYADWLLSIFDIWYESEEAPSIRIFESIMRLLLGKRSLVESIGPDPVDLVVIEADGQIEAVDSLKSCYEGAAYTGLSVSRNSFDEALKHPAILSRQLGVGSLCQTCQSCKYVSVCGGGYQPHRFSSDSGFLNPSVYCSGLMLMINRIATRMGDDFSQAGHEAPPRIKEMRGARKLS
jgi:uncharacterized protein